MKNALPFLMALVLALVTPAHASNPAQNGAFTFKNPALGAKVTAIFKQSCTSCHGNTSPAADLNVLDFKKLVSGQSSSNLKYLNAQKPEQSLLYEQIASNLMPKLPTKLTAQEKATVLAWIKSEVGQPAVGQQRAILTEAEIMKLVVRRLETAGPDEAKTLRFISFHNLNNDPRVTASDIATARKGVSKLLNSLSWKSTIVLPTALDPAKMVYAIDLANLGWDSSMWDRLMSFYPYGIEYEGADMSRIRALSGQTLPWVRGDWLVFKAARPPLYHDLLKLPNSAHSDQDLEAMLAIDAKANILAGNVARAGFRGGKFGSKGSGVSDHNRLIERHSTRFGAYWKSYDFGASEGEQDLLGLPLGPRAVTGSALGFRHGGGEVIFNLPNGMQAYLLVDSSGKRLDQGPIEIVRDKTHGGRPVINGISCISCHSQGTNRQFDQVSDFTRNNPDRFMSVQAEIDRLYVSDETLKTFFDQDDQRFSSALEAAQARDGTREPVTVTSDRFEEPLDFQKAAAELGMTTNALEAALANKPELQSLKASLRTGGITRDGFIGVFQRLVSGLGLGKPLLPKRKPDPEPVPAPDPLPPKRPAGPLMGRSDAQVTLQEQLRELRQLLKLAGNLSPGRATAVAQGTKIISNFVVDAELGAGSSCDTTLQFKIDQKLTAQIEGSGSSSSNEVPLVDMLHVFRYKFNWADLDSDDDLFEPNSDPKNSGSPSYRIEETGILPEAMPMFNAGFTAIGLKLPNLTSAQSALRRRFIDKTPRNMDESEDGSFEPSSEINLLLVASRDDTRGLRDSLATVTKKLIRACKRLKFNP